MRTDKLILKTGIFLIGILLMIIGIYELSEKHQKIQPVVYPEKNQPEVTLSGYEEADEILEYMIYQLGTQNLDYALRGCAFQDIAECFSLKFYTEYLDRFENIDLIPPADGDSPAYTKITNARLAAGYARALEYLMEIFQSGSLNLLKIADDVPDNPDGMYYQKRNQICEILGARSLEEKIVYLQIGEQKKELRCTLVRYRKYWKVLFFHPLQDTGVDIVDLQDSAFSGTSKISLDAYMEEVLPCNFYLLNDNSEDDPQTVLKRFFLCLQRKDAQAAMSYIDIHEVGGDRNVSVERLESQERAAYCIQEIYYRTLLHDNEYVRWISKNIAERGTELIDALSTNNMLFTQATRLEEIQNDGQISECYFYWVYEEEWLRIRVFLENKNGWKITDISWV